MVKRLLLGPLLVTLFIVVAVVSSATGVNFNFTGNTTTDLTPYTVLGFTDDGAGCDKVAVVYTDAAGVTSDIDAECIPPGGSGLGSYGPGSYAGSNHNIGQVSPLTVSVFDLPSGSTPCDLAFENTLGCGVYLFTQAICVGETYWYVTDLPFTGSPYALCSFNPVNAASGGCSLNIPDGSVVGEAPLGAQVYYSPGNVSPQVVLNPGTYIVVGQDESETYYKIVLACQFVWVRQDTMQPSFQAPQNGAPLPTRIVS